LEEWSPNWTAIFRDFEELFAFLIVPGFVGCRKLSSTKRHKEVFVATRFAPLRRRFRLDLRLPAASLSTAMSPARYFPIESGRYEVKPGLFKFGTDFGNGDADRQVFQIDDQFPRYHAAKMEARQERLSKYFQTHDYRPATARRVARFILERLPLTRPSDCGENIIAASRELGLDALACRVQEDLAAIQRDGDRHWLAAIHLCFPNHWAAEDKIGKTFSGIHAPVAGIEPINRQADKMVDAMINATQGYVRFVWGIATDDRLNHHPSKERGRHFDPRNPRAFLRIERQTIWGFPEVEASLFTIRTYFEDLATLEQDKRAKVISAIESMTPASLQYKGLAESRDDLLAWLRVVL
jgi:hypothetical protein